MKTFTAFLFTLLLPALVFGQTVAQGAPGTTSDARAWPFKIVFAGAQIDPRDTSDRAGRLVGKITFDGAQPVTQSGAWAISFTAPQHVIIDSATLGTVTVTGPLTDVQLRATPVPISGTVTANAGTDLNTSALALAATQTNRTQKTQLTDGVQDVTVKDPFVAPTTADTALVVSSRDTLSLVQGQTGIDGGSGNQSIKTPRVVLATNVGLPAGTQILGKVGIDQTTPGTTNGVVVNSAPLNATTNVTQFGGFAVATGPGQGGNGVPRVSIAVDAVTGVGFSATVGLVSIQIVAATATRKAFYIVNTSNATVSCNESGGAAVLNSGITLLPGASYSMLPPLVTTGSINCIASAAGSNLSLMEKS